MSRINILFALLNIALIGLLIYSIARAHFVYLWSNINIEFHHWLSRPFLYLSILISIFHLLVVFRMAILKRHIVKLDLIKSALLVLSLLLALKLTSGVWVDVLK